MELPFTLTHPKPPMDDEAPAITAATGTQTNHFSVTSAQTTRETERDISVVDASLISIDTRFVRYLNYVEELKESFYNVIQCKI